MDLKRVSYTVTVETTDDNPVPTPEDVSRNVLKLREDFPDAAVFVTDRRETNFIGGTWHAGYEFVKFSIMEVVDNDEAVYTKVLNSVRVASANADQSRAEHAGETVYRIVALKLGIMPVGSRVPTRPSTFADVLVTSLISSPGDDTSGMWAEIGQYYLDKAAEGA